MWFFRRLNDPAFTSHFPAILVKPITFECRNLLPLFINDQREEVCYDCLYVVLFLFYCMVIKTLCCFVLTLMTLLYSFESIILQKSMLFSVEVNFTPSFPTYLSPCKKTLTDTHMFCLCWPQGHNQRNTLHLETKKKNVPWGLSLQDLSIKLALIPSKERYFLIEGSKSKVYHQMNWTLEESS